MISYKEQLALIQPIRVSENITKRIDCPFCGGKNTFTLSSSNIAVTSKAQQQIECLSQLYQID